MRVLLCAWRFDARGGCRKYAAACLTALQHGQRCGACRDGTRCELWPACHAATDVYVYVYVWRALVCVGVRVLLCAWRSDARGGCRSYAAACLHRVPNSSLQHGQRCGASGIAPGASCGTPAVLCN